MLLIELIVIAGIGALFGVEVREHHRELTLDEQQPLRATTRPREMVVRSPEHHDLRGDLVVPHHQHAVGALRLTPALGG